MNEIQVSQVPEEVINQATSIFDALKDNTRLKILISLLSGEKSVSELTEVVCVSQSAVSHQMRLLRDRGLVRSTRQGQFVKYSLSDKHVQVLIEVSLEHASELFKEDN